MTYYVMGVGGGVQNPLSPHAKIFFNEKWKKEGGEIGGRCLHFFTLLILGEAVQKHSSWHYLYRTVGGGGANAGRG